MILKQNILGQKYVEQYDGNMENLVWLVSGGTKCKISAAGRDFCKNPENQLERTKGRSKQFC